MPLTNAVRLVLDASTEVSTGAMGHPGLAVHFCNAYNVALARDDASYARLLQQADVVFSDGVPIAWVGKRAYPARARQWERVSNIVRQGEQWQPQIDTLKLTEE